MNRTNRHICLFFALTILGLIGAGCAPSSDITPIAIPTHTATLPPQNTPTFPFHADLSCWQTKPLQPENGIEGSLILGYGSSSFYWDVSSFRAKSFLENVDWVPFLPPDRSYISASSWDMPKAKKINLIFLDKHIVTIDLPPAEGYGFLPLLDGNILVTLNVTGFIRSPSEDKNYQEGIGYTDTYYIYDSKTGSQIEEHSVFLPDFTYFYEATLYHPTISYSPDGHYALYLSKSPNGQDSFSLLDLRSNQVKWTVPASKRLVGALDEGPPEPTWKPDGSGLTYIWASDDEWKEQNFYNVSLDGTILQFTKFEETFQPGYVLAFNPQWSPDGRYMAFKVRKAPYPADNFETLIWDDTTKTLLNPCLPDIAGPLIREDMDWSFDSRHIAVIFPNPPKPYVSGSEYRWRNVILDVSDRLIYELPDDTTMRNYLKVTDNAFSYRVGSWINWEIP